MSKLTDTVTVHYAEPMFGAQVGEVQLRIHGPDDCLNEFCTFHNPSNHPLKEAPINFRGDTGVVERICEHGIGHPDPDHIAWRKGTGNLNGLSVHGCDGCCRA